MPQRRFRNPFLAGPMAAALLVISCTGVTAQTGKFPPDRDKIVGAYFEEWSIYGANYNVADIQSSGAATVLTHVLYAFANVSTTGQCAIGDSWADYQDP
jgi:chitinase